MRLVRFWMGLSILSLLPSACGEDFSTKPGAGLSEVPKLYAESLCQAVGNCAPQYVDIFFGPNDCKALMTKRIEQASLPLFEAAVAAHTMTYNPDKLSACLKKIADQGCKAFDGVYIDVCESALGGTVEVDGACAFDGECKGDAYCKYDGTCPGVCTTRELDGATCRDNSECLAGLECFEGQCRVKIAEGGNCKNGDVGCKSGLLCGPDAGSGKTCVPIATVFSQGGGQPCDIVGAAWCEKGTYCAVAEVSLQGATQVCAEAADSGGPCNFSVSDMCPKSEYCAGTEILASPPVIAGNCRALPLAGDPCTNLADLGKACAAGHVCVLSGAEGTCRQLQENGRTCEVDQECYSESCVAGRCAPKGDCEVTPAG